jgi:hypothetical protein
MMHWYIGMRLCPSILHSNALIFDCAFLSWHPYNLCVIMGNGLKYRLQLRGSLSSSWQIILISLTLIHGHWSQAVEPRIYFIKF